MNLIALIVKNNYVNVDGIGVMCVKILPLARTSGFTFVTDLDTTTTKYLAWYCNNFIWEYFTWLYKMGCGDSSEILCWNIFNITAITNWAARHKYVGATSPRRRRNIRRKIKVLDALLRIFSVSDVFLRLRVVFTLGYFHRSWIPRYIEGYCVGKCGKRVAIHLWYIFLWKQKLILVLYLIGNVITGVWSRISW